MQPDQVITAVRKETGIKLSAADPVLAAAAINAVLLDAALAKLAIDGGGNRQARGAQCPERGGREACASDVINSAADWLGARFKETAQEATAEMLAECARRPLRLRRRTGRDRQRMRRASSAPSVSAILGFGFGL